MIGANCLSFFWRFFGFQAKIVWRKLATPGSRIVITKTCLYNFDPLKPHFYIVKLGFTGVYTIFLILLDNIDCGYSLEPPRRGGSNEYHNLCFEQKCETYQSFLSENFQFLEVKFSIYLNRRVFVMEFSMTVYLDTTMVIDWDHKSAM